jgi:hypothetical protein
MQSLHEHSTSHRYDLPGYDEQKELALSSLFHVSNEQASHNKSTQHNIFPHALLRHKNKKHSLIAVKTLT